MRNVKNNGKVKKEISEPIILNDNFLKVESMDGGIDYLPLVDIRYPAILQFYNNPDNPDLKNTHRKLSYTLYNGEQYIDKTEYKSLDKAEKVMNKVINRLPKITSINRITQNIVANQEVEEQQEDIPKPSIGFQLN